MKKTDTLVNVALLCQDRLRSAISRKEKADWEIGQNKIKINEAVYKCVIEYDMLQENTWYITLGGVSGASPVTLHGGSKSRFPKIKRFPKYFSADTDIMNILEDIDVDEGIATLNIIDRDDIAIYFHCHRHAANFIAKHKLRIDHIMPAYEVRKEIRNVQKFQSDMKKEILKRRKYHAKTGNRNRK